MDVPGHVLERVIGRGATSVVWAGRDSAGRPVALKVPHVGSDDVDRMQSATEREVLMALRHDHLVTLRGVVPLADGRVVSVFDLVDGASLRSTVDARGQLRTGETVTVVTPICDAVATLHRAGALHGDISPGNVLITADGRPLLADLGAARVAGTGAAVLGTPGFVAPEVLAGEVPSEASDVFAIGALAWFCLTGRGVPDTLLRLDPQAVVDAVGPELAGVVTACIDPDPARRPPSDRLGHAVFSAATAEPIEVVVGADEASALTHRIRMNAAARPEPGDGAARRRGRSLIDWGRRWVSGRTARWVVPAAALTVALVAVGWHAWSLVGDPLEAPRAGGRPIVKGAAAPPAAAPESAQGQPHPTSAPTAHQGVLTDALAPRTSPDALLRILAERRTTLLVRRDPAALGGVHLGRSPAWAADAAVLAELERRGQRYDGLGVAAVRAESISATPDRAVIRGRVDLTAYVVVEASGERSARPATAGQQLDFVLVRTKDGWRIEAVSEPAAT